jgi:hypothetical protein
MPTVDPFDPNAATRDHIDAAPYADAEGRLLPGVRIAERYRIVTLLGRGGMGEVYRADDVKLGQPAALKFLPIAVQRNPHHLARLLDEVRLARQVSHPNVCRVYDLGEWQRRQFLSMEFIDGEDFASLLKRIGRLPPEKALDIARQLCAGVAAAHQAGVLHRDLKPSNIMLDGRGRVRITDFGIAIATERLSDLWPAAGTPAYLAPEQLEGRAASVRSDLYALGLVLYEVFTGRPAPSAAPPVFTDVDPAVGAAIARCLERDPALRPASARDLAALLPGDDPLDVAVAAGDTPSPELVAASGPDGALRPPVAFGALALTLGLLLVAVMLSDKASLLGWMAWPHSPAALEDNARGILERLGIDAAAIDHAQSLMGNNAWASYVWDTDSSPGRWGRLREPGQFGLLYWYRQAPRFLVPVGRTGTVTDTDPVPGGQDVQILTNLRGHLLFFSYVPRAAEAPAAAPVAPDWDALFREAGLDRARFQPTPPTRNPHVDADVRAAWLGTLPDFGNYPVRIEAAAHRGVPVYFEQVVPWDPYWNPAGAPGAAPRSRFLAYGFTSVFVVVVMLLMTVRNLSRDRGDRHGAFRLARAVFVLRLAVWILGGHHVAAPQGEALMLLTALGKALTDAAAIWCFYIALEPEARRLHPRLLVSWTRLVRGRWRDPLVGRDVLGGVVASALVILLWGELYFLIPHALGRAAPSPAPLRLGLPPFMYLLDSAPTETLLGGRRVLEALPVVALTALAFTLGWTMILLGFRLLLRNGWIALAALILLVTLLSRPTTLSNFSAIGIACSCAAALVMASTLRFGLLGMLAMWFCFDLWMEFPVSANVNAPYFGTGLIAIAAIAALALYGARLAAVQRVARVV